MNDKARKRIGNIAGWYGTAVILIAYVLASFSYLPADQIPYQLLNLSGAVGFIILGTTHGIRQTVTLNSVWCVIALVAIAKMLMG